MSVRTISRRQTLQWMAGSVVLGLLSASGCGGLFGGSNGVAMRSVTVPFALPNGFGIPVAQLAGETVWDTQPLGNGIFNTKLLAGSKPILGFLRDTQADKYVLAGIVGGGTSGVSPLGAAVALVAMALGIFGLAASDAASLIEQLEVEPSVQQLAQIIEQQLLIDPYALFSDNAAIDAALSDAYSALAPSTGPTAPIAAKPRAGNANLLLIQPGDQSMARVIQADNDTGSVTLYNLGRRPMTAYVYRTGDEDSNGVRTDLPTPELISGPTDLDVTDGLIDGLLHLRWSFQPKKGATVPLPVHPGKNKTFYEVLTLMASAADGAPEPAFFLEPHYQPFVADWRAKLADLNLQAGIGGLFAHFVQAIIGGSVAGFADSAITATIVANLRALEESLISTAVQQLQNSIYKPAITNCLSAVGGAEREALKNFILKWPGRQVGGQALTDLRNAAVEQAAVLQAAAKLALRVLGTIGAILTALDWGFDASDLVASSRGEKWSATALNPTVLINPNTVTLPPNVEQPFSAQIVAGLPGDTYRYIWTLTGGSSSVLSDRSVNPPVIGRSIETDSDQVTLAVSPSEVDQTHLVVEVEALRVEIIGGVRRFTSIGTAHANVTVDSQASTFVFDRIDVTMDGQTEQIWETRGFFAITPHPDDVFIEWTRNYYVVNDPQQPWVPEGTISEAFEVDLVPTTTNPNLTLVHVPNTNLGRYYRRANDDNIYLLIYTYDWSASGNSGTLYNIMTGQRQYITTEEQAETYERQVMTVLDPRTDQGSSASSGGWG